MQVAPATASILTWAIVTSACCQQRAQIAEGLRCGLEERRVEGDGRVDVEVDRLHRLDAGSRPRVTFSRSIGKVETAWLNELRHAIGIPAALTGAGTVQPDDASAAAADARCRRHRWCRRWRRWCGLERLACATGRVAGCRRCTRCRRRRSTPSAVVDTSAAARHRRRCRQRRTHRCSGAACSRSSPEVHHRCRSCTRCRRRRSHRIGLRVAVDASAGTDSGSTRRRSGLRWCRSVPSGNRGVRADRHAGAVVAAIRGAVVAVVAEAGACRLTGRKTGALHLDHLGLVAVHSRRRW